MIRSITIQKSMDKLERLLEGSARIFIIGCGTCVTLTHTGGETETAAMADNLTKNGKLVTGRIVTPVACDNLSSEMLVSCQGQIRQADCLLVMTCAFGVQTIARQLMKLTIPALDTIFIGKETSVGRFDEICIQCGDCFIGETGGICPVTACHKGLVNGPCGGTNKGKCEIDMNKDCAWTSIYKRLMDLEHLDSMRKFHPPRSYHTEPKPGKWSLASIA